MKHGRTAILLLALLAPAAHAQFSLYRTSCSAGQLVGTLFDFGSVNTSQPDVVTFCLLNSTGQTQTMALLSVGGVGFSLSGAAAPTSVKAGGSVSFTVTFQGALVAAYSGSLLITGISVTLLADVAPGLTYEVQLPSGASILGASPVDFGSVQMGSNATLNFLAVNQTAAVLTVGPIGVSTGDFALAGSCPSGTVLDPQASAAFAIKFSPAAAGTRTAVLSIGSMQFTLTGIAPSLPPPPPLLSVTLGEAQSAQQGSVAVSFGAPAAAGGSGTVTLSFYAQEAGATDPGIAFAAGGQSVPFTFNQGDTAAHFGAAGSAQFQTGTTAGTITLAAQIGNQVTQQNVVIAPELIAIAAVAGTRQTSAVTVNITGFDNTRTAGLLTFTFYDSNGNAIPPGAIPYQDAAGFSTYFAASDDGGQFELAAYFPVNGSPLQVSAFTVQLVNAAGTATTARANF